MKKGSHKYRFVKQLNGIGRNGSVEIEIRFRKHNSMVTDNCDWKTMKESFPDFKGSEIWKKSAIVAANSIIESFETQEPIEIIIKDIHGLYVDTSPSYIGAATIIGIFDYLDKPLDQNALNSIDNFVDSNRDFFIIPDFNQLRI
jgi:hypothetical protein